MRIVLAAVLSSSIVITLSVNNFMIKEYDKHLSEIIVENKGLISENIFLFNKCFNLTKPNNSDINNKKQNSPKRRTNERI